MEFENWNHVTEKLGNRLHVEPTIYRIFGLKKPRNATASCFLSTDESMMIINQLEINDRRPNRRQGPCGAEQFLSQEMSSRNTYQQPGRETFLSHLAHRYPSTLLLLWPLYFYITRHQRHLLSKNNARQRENRNKFLRCKNK